jgi:uncharacterized protein (TIGR00369 family)
MDHTPLTDLRPVRGHLLDPAALRMSGLERHTRQVRGDYKPPAINHLTGLRPTEISFGRAAFAMPASAWGATAHGFYSGATVALLVDAPLALAIESVLPAGKVAPTSEISMNFIAPAFPGPGQLVARARVIDVGSRLGFSEAEVTDHRGRLVAHATSRCVVTDAPESGDTGQVQVDPEWSADESPDPWEMPATGATDVEIATMSGVEFFRRVIDGSQDLTPLGYLLGTTPTAVDEGAITWTARATPWWSSPAPMLYGGALAAFAETAFNTSFWTVIQPTQAYATLDLKIQYVRPVFPDDGVLTAAGRVVHRGRSIAIATVEVTNAAGKTVLYGTGSAAILPDGAALMRFKPD